MKLEVNETETKTIRRALVHWTVKLQDATKNIQLKEVWDVFGNELDNCENIIKKIKENETN